MSASRDAIRGLGISSHVAWTNTEAVTWLRPAWQRKAWRNWGKWRQRGSPQYNLMLRAARVSEKHVIKYKISYRLVKVRGSHYTRVCPLTIEVNGTIEVHLKNSSLYILSIPINPNRHHKHNGYVEGYLIDCNISNLFWGQSPPSQQKDIIRVIFCTFTRWY